MLRPTTMIRHISFVEFNQMMNTLADRLRGKGIEELTPVDKHRDLIPCAYLAYKLGAQVTDNGKKFSVMSSTLPDVCIFKKVYPSDHYNSINENYLEEIEVSEDGWHTKITFEWEK